MTMDNNQDTPTPSRMNLLNPMRLTVQFLIAILLGVLIWLQFGGELLAKSPSGYYTVILDNNQGFYARIAQSNRESLLLEDVWYLKQVVNDETKQASTVLAPRVGEIYAPTAMVVMKSSIAFLEPVGAESEIARKIKALNSQTGK